MTLESQEECGQVRVTHTRKRTLESEWQSVVNLCHQAAWWLLAGSLEVIERMVPAAWRSD